MIYLPYKFLQPAAAPSCSRWRKGRRLPWSRSAISSRQRDLGTRWFHRSCLPSGGNESLRRGWACLICATRKSWLAKPPGTSLPLRQYLTKVLSFSFALCLAECTTKCLQWHANHRGEYWLSKNGSLYIVLMVTPRHLRGHGQQNEVLRQLKCNM